LAITIPLNEPNITPTNKPSKIASQGARESWTINPVIRVPVSATIEPTDKSIPPVIITKVIPHAIIAFKETCLARLIIFLLVKKYGFENVKANEIIMNPIKA